MATIAIPIENKVREFYGKLYLSATLAQAGHKVALGDKSHIRIVLGNEVQPDIYIAKTMNKGGGTTELFKKLNRWDCQVAVLDAEGGLGSSKEYWLEHNVTKDVLEYVDAVFAWGGMQADALMEEMGFPQQGIYKTGNPRFDLLQPNLREIYIKQAHDLKKTYGDYVLINTNFGWVNPFDKELNQQVFSERDIKSVQQVYDEQSKLLSEFLSMIDELNNIIDQDIIVRPHPGENFDTYRSEFYDNPGIHVEHFGDVRDWIAGADAVIHNNCTTGIESALLEKRTIAYEPGWRHDPRTDFSLPNYLSLSAKNEEELGKLINERGGSYQISHEQRKKLQSWLYSIDEFAAPKIVNGVKELIDDDFATVIPTPSTQQWLRNSIKQIPIVILLRKQLRKRTGKKKQKIPSLTLNEVQSTMKALNAQTESLSVQRVNYLDDVYWISR